MKTVETKMLISKMRNIDLKNKKERMEYIGKTEPYGYLKKNRKLVKNPETSHIVYLIYDLYDKGCSFTQIANYLNERGIVSPTYYKQSGNYISMITMDENKKWSRCAVRKIILNKVYNGYYKYSEIKTHEEIINDELFKRVQERIKNKQNCSGNDFYYHNGNIFSNKVYCAECGRVFTLSYSRNKENRVYYLKCSCEDTRRERKINCVNKDAIRYEELKDILSFFIENEIYNKVDLEIANKVYEKELKQDDVDIQRFYLKQEKNILINKIENIQNNDIIETDLIGKLKKEEQRQLLQLYNNRLSEINSMLKEIYSFARTKSFSKKELYIDKFFIEEFVDKITIGKVDGLNRSIDIILK